MRAARTRYRTLGHDSQRWQDFPFRAGDVVITTHPKCGTTWTQMICALLIFQRPELPRPLAELSPWLDLLSRERDAVVAQLEAQRHRRFIKSHTPLDGLPLDPRVTYVCVGRDPRDVAVSMDHHMANFNVDAFLARRRAVEGDADTDAELARIGYSKSTDAVDRFWAWMDSPEPVETTRSSLAFTLRHFEEALRARHEPNVVVLHYADMMADLAGTMRELAARLQIEVPEERLPELVEAASFRAMRERASEVIPNSDDGFFRSPEGFFHTGGSGAFRAFFDEAAEQRYAARIAELTTPEVAAWAHRGARALKGATDADT